jgi:transposase
MPRASSLDLRDRVLAVARDAALSRPALAVRLRVSDSTVYASLRRARATSPPATHAATSATAAMRRCEPKRELL